MTWGMGTILRLKDEFSGENILISLGLSVLTLLVASNLSPSAVPKDLESLLILFLKLAALYCVVSVSFMSEITKRVTPKVEKELENNEKFLENISNTIKPKDGETNP